MKLGMIALYIAGAFVFIKVVTYVFVVKALLGLRFKYGGCEVRGEEEVPEYIKKLISKDVEELESRGFVYLHTQLYDEPFVTDYSKRWNMVYYNRSEKCYANVSMASMNSDSGVKIELSSHLENGAKVLTLNGMAHDIIGQVPNTTVVDAYTLTFAGQMNAHRMEVEKSCGGMNFKELSPDAFAKYEKDLSDEYITWLRDNSYLTETADGFYRLRFAAALKQAFKYMKGMGKAAALNKARNKSRGAQAVEIPIEVEKEAFLRTQQMLAPRKMGYIGKAATFVVSLVIFASIFGVSMRFEILPILIGTLIIHELGHAAGMKMFNYKDIQIFFLPFGAATTGMENNTTPLKKVIIYLLGPGPGIIAGAVMLCVYYVTKLEFLQEAGLFMMVLNYLNMLPILPLDGGRVFEDTLFARAHYLKSALVVVSALALLAAGVCTHDWILGVLGILLTAGIKVQLTQNWACAKMRQKMKAESIEPADDAMTGAIFSVLRDNRCASMAWAKKYNIAKHVLETCKTELPGAGVITVAMLMYLGVLVAPIIVLIVFAIVSALTGQVFLPSR